MSRSGFNPSGAKIKGVSPLTCKRGFIAHYLQSPIASVIDKIHAAYTLTTAQNVTAGITQPDVPRVLSITGTKAGGSLTGDVVITGTDVAGAVITDTIVLSDNLTVNGVKAFKTVTSIHFPAKVTTADTVKIGTTDLLGIIHLLSHNTIIPTYSDIPAYGYDLMSYVDSKATWSSIFKHSGNYSVRIKLPTPVTADDGSLVLIPLGTGWYEGGTMKLSEFEEFIYHFYVRSGSSISYGPHMVLCLHDPVTPAKKIDITLEVSMTPALINATMTKNAWVKITVKPGEGGDAFWWNNADGSSAAAKGDGGTPAENVRGALADIVADSLFCDYVIDMMAVELGWWEGTGGTAYVDDVFINGVSYDFEPIVLNTPIVSVSASVLALNTVKPHKVIDGSAVDFYYIV